MTKETLFQRFRDPITVLDHGFVQLLDVMGDDNAIVDAARVSYTDSTAHTRGARGLIRYLVRHQHHSPLEMCEIKVGIRAPIFISRQFLRHRTASVNEMSGRYSEMLDLFYVPKLDRILAQDQHNRQGSGDALDPTTVQSIVCRLDTAYRDNHLHYKWMLEQGVARETARINLPLSQYTQWYWKIDLRNLLHFIHLRMDHHAQYEIRVYAEALWRIVQAWVPLTAEAFMDYVLDAVTFSKLELEWLREHVTWPQEVTDFSGSAGETRELEEKLKRLSCF